MSVICVLLQLLICGQAMSHCVNYTTRDIMDHWDKAMGALVVLTDGKLFISIYVSVSMF